MANGWTPERRLKQSEAIRRWQPWTRSTGPRTPEGKAVSAMNRYSGGRTRDLMREVRKLLRDSDTELKQLEATLRNAKSMT